MRTGIILLILVILSGACSKSSLEEKDTFAPVVVISSPLNGEVFTGGQMIDIKGKVTDDKFIAEIHIHVFDKNTGSSLMDIHFNPGSTISIFNQSIMLVAGVNYKIQVTAKDGAVNEGGATIEISCN